MIRPSRRVACIAPPPIARMAALAQDLEASGRRVIRLSQAVPWYGPPPWALEALGASLRDPVLHRYSPDPGLADVREALCSRWFAPRGLTVDPESEIQLTCGASQAFMNALTAVADPGQRVVLTDPYYFDHLFAVQFLGLKARFVRMHEDEAGFSLDADAIVEEIRAGCAAVIIVDPANPTGSTASEGALRRIAGECEASGTTLIIDETYERIRFDPPSRWRPCEDPGTRPVTLLVGSFSKSLGMAGWRLGYLVGPRTVLDQALKVHDSVAICAPVPAQVLLREALRGPFEEWLRLRLEELGRRRNLVQCALGHSSFFSLRSVSGGIFTLPAYRSPRPSIDVAAALLEHTGILTVPGAAFGTGGEGHLRVSFGSSSEGDLSEAAALLSAYEGSFVDREGSVPIL